MISYSFSFSYLNRQFFLRQEAKSMLWHVCFTRDWIFVAVSKPTSPGWLCGWSPGWNASSHCITEALQRKSLWCTVHYQSPVPFVLLLRILKVYLVFITSLVFPLMVPTGRSAWELSLCGLSNSGGVKTSGSGSEGMATSSSNGSSILVLSNCGGAQDGQRHSTSLSSWTATQ